MPAPEQDGRRASAPSPVRDSAIDGLSLIVIGVLLGEVLGNGHGWLRAVTALAFLVFVPGWAVATNWPAMKERSLFGFPVVLSLVFLTLGGTVELWVDHWDPTALLVAECALCIVALAIGSGRRILDHRRESAALSVRPEPDDG